jgi:negative regulator of flagellin synthesis FlgM
VAPLKGTSTGGVAADKSPSDAAATATSQTGDHVTLTSSARSLQRLSDAIAQVPVVDAAKVASIKNAVSSGTYKIDAASVADKLLHFDSALK